MLAVTTHKSSVGKSWMHKFNLIASKKKNNNIVTGFVFPSFLTQSNIASELVQLSSVSCSQQIAFEWTCTSASALVTIDCKDKEGFYMQVIVSLNWWPLARIQRTYIMDILCRLSVFLFIFFFLHFSKRGNSVVVSYCQFPFGSVVCYVVATTYFLTF